MPKINRPNKQRIDIAIDQKIYSELRRRLRDPTRRDGKMKHGVLNTLVTTLLSQWLAKGVTLEELIEEHADE